MMLDASGAGVGSPRTSSLVPWIAGVVALLAVGGGVFWYVTGDGEPTEPAAAPTAGAAPVAPVEPPAPAGPVAVCGATGDVALPPLGESDTLIGTLVGSLSTHPQVTAWLATGGLIRNFVVVVDNIASGASPAVHLGRLRPDGRFMVTGDEEDPRLDPRSYERYGPIADAVESVDPQAAARLCGTLKPRLDEAYAELGGGGTFEATLERAIVALLRTPPLGDDVRLVESGALYAFEDPALERLTPAQKHLARMGARNTRVIQDKLRQIALAIGIPADRLPR